MSLVHALFNLTDLPTSRLSISANRLTPLSCSLYSTEPRLCRGKKMLLGSRNRTRHFLSFFLFVIFSSAAITQRETRADRPAIKKESSAALSSVIDSGVEQERSTNWIDAIATS